MAEQHVCDMKHIKTHGKDFADEIKYYLNKYSISQKELALRLGLSIKHINSILQNNVIDVSVSVLEALEYVFRLETGTLTEVYHVYSNFKNAYNLDNIEKTLTEFGVNFLVDHPELAIAANISIYESTPSHIKLMMIKRFYGVSKLSYYNDYLREHVLADESHYKSPNTKIWIRFCELLASSNNKIENFGSFRKLMFQTIFRKILKIMVNINLSFEQKITMIKEALLIKGIVLVTMPFIENSLINAITLKKGSKRYIFLSDMFHSEAYIFYSLLHEMIHCYFPNYDENQIDERLSKEYEAFVKVKKNIEYDIIGEAIKVHRDFIKAKQENTNVDLGIFWTPLQEKFPYVAFEELNVTEEIKNSDNDEGDVRIISWPE
ncbi:helix-turn-helix domain-containing protein [Mycoplasma phocoeninasale]|uniref:Helix-turn-helix transcriptional regulator n=1 Tax=Mycoplasma phocoeninasale TaxID=2726117 RepID=A0A858U3N9_9MOLU|nr:helix-turn-helix transcriptional regulator [Mycoplasma phocoeninasale]MBN0970754.1 helix-turn-helix transcriptional regulator [Mycoplasma phocoeninasale]QJG66611.1 helix-turn-helix transcriptional regulator [Mycoplasma phocoeninasale]